MKYTLKLFTLLLVAFLTEGFAGKDVRAAVSIQQTAYNVDIELASATVKTFADAFTAQTGIVFSYESNLALKQLGKVSLHRQNAEIGSLLSSVLGGKGFSYRIINSTVVLSYEAPVEVGQNVSHSVSGIVCDANGAPVPGVGVIISGTTNGTTTDIDGKYTINVKNDAVLEFSSLGFKSISEKVGTRGVINVTLEEDREVLDEVVVVGYGVQKKVNLTGSVAQINFDEALESRPVMNTSSALGGLAAGMQVRQSSGQPGSDGASILIRGNTTLNNNNPLVLVDGIEWSMDNINTNDIATISVLKDAASTAIYGSRAANGVILITTKLGTTKEKSKVSYSFNGAWQMPYNRLGWVSDYITHMNLVNESRENMDMSHIFSSQTIQQWAYANEHPNELNEYGVPNHIAYPNTDWFSEIFSTGFSQNHNISVEGASQKVRYLISLGYLDNQGVMNKFSEINSGTKKVDFRANVEAQATDFITVGARVFGNRQSYGLANISNAFSYIYQTTPGVAPGKPGAWGSAINRTEEATNANNVFMQMRGSEGHNIVYRLNASVYTRIKFLKMFSVDVTGNYAPDFTDKNTWASNNITWNYTTNTKVSEGKLANATNTNSYGHTDRINFEALLRFNKSVKKHDIGAIAGFSTNYYHNRSFNASKIGSPDWSITEMSAYTDQYGMPGSSSSEWSLMSFFGRVNYAFNEKYLFEANVRADGSSRFSPERRWGIFPSFSGGWRIDKEDWLSGADFLSNLKLRASWGVTGNNNSGNYAWQATYSTVNVVVGGINTKGLLQTALGNDLLEWETTYTTNVGVDFGFFENKFTGEIDGYLKKTSGILFKPSIYETMGTVTGAYANIAEVSNRGVEVALNYRDHFGKDFNISAGLNVAYNVGYVDKYKGTLVKEWVDGKYVNNYSDVAQSGFGGLILEGSQLGEHYFYKLYRGTGTGYSGGMVDINAGPKDGMIRTENDLIWVQEMMKAGYSFCGTTKTGKDQLWYGDLIYADINGDKNYGDTNDQDFTGHSSIPKFTMGLTLSASWKGIDIYALFSGAFGFWLNWGTQYYNTTKVTNGHSISSRIAQDHYFYDPENLFDPRTNIRAEFPRLTYADDLNNSKTSDFREYRGDYLKLKNVQVGYTLPARISMHAKISKLRIFFSAENIFTITKFPGMDPEVGTTIGYPLMRSLSIGAQVSF